MILNDTLFNICLLLPVGREIPFHINSKPVNMDFHINSKRVNMDFHISSKPVNMDFHQNT